MDDDEILVLVKRLARPHPSGGTVIERAAIMASGAGSKDVMTWIVAHGGTPEATTARKGADRGIHSWRVGTETGAESRTPSRFVLPAGALD
jgi:hypothetical protein